MTVREYAEIFSDMNHCSKCYKCKADGILCRRSIHTEINIEPWKNYPNIYDKLKCQYKSPCFECNSCSLNNKGICEDRTPKTIRTIDQEIEQFLRTATGEVEIYE